MARAFKAVMAGWR
jgi:hypothetical protein